MTCKAINYQLPGRQRGMGALQGERGMPPGPGLDPPLMTSSHTGCIVMKSKID